MTADRVQEIYDRNINEAIQKASGSSSVQAALMLLKLNAKRQIAEESAGKPKRQVKAL